MVGWVIHIELAAISNTWRVCEKSKPIELHGGKMCTSLYQMLEREFSHASPPFPSPPPLCVCVCQLHMLASSLFHGAK